MQYIPEKVCPRCGSHKLKSWCELTDDEKILVTKLPLSAEFSIDERCRIRWCARCWHELGSSNEVTV